MAKITKDMTIIQVLQMDEGVVPILLNAGLHCLGCPGAQRESLQDAGVVHGINVDELVDNINNYLAAK